MTIKSIENLYFDLTHFVTKQWAWFVAILIAAFFVVSGKREALTDVTSVIEAVTLMAVLFTAFNILRKQRIDDLDKKLTVVFLYDKKIILKCENAYLAGESDIRQWGQSIGQLMNKGKRLDFDPYIREESVIEQYKNKQYKHYTVTFTLHSAEDVAQKNLDLYNQGQYALWFSELDGSGKKETEGTHT